MNMLRGIKRLLQRVLPRSTFWQFFIATAIIGVITALIAILVAFGISRQLVHKLMEETGYTVLANAADYIGRSRSNIEQYRVSVFEADQKMLRNAADRGVVLFEAYRSEEFVGHLTRPEAQKAALEQLLSEKLDKESRLLVFDEQMQQVGQGQDTGTKGGNAAGLSSGVREIYGQLAKQAKNAEHNEIIQVYHIGDYGPVPVDVHLALARYYAPWELVLVADLNLQTNASLFREQERTQLDELRARMGEIVIGKSGYIYALDADCNIMIHPTLSGVNLADAKPLVNGLSLCRAVQETAIKPWGTNKLEYNWDRIGQSRNYVFPKIVWCTREPTTGWYVGASVYVEEVEEDLPRYVLLIFFPALGAILVLGGALALLLRSLLKPIHELTVVCQEVSNGDLDATAREDAPGEMGFLAQHFNVMIRTVRELIQLDALRQQELEVLNKSLETKVQERTQDLKQKTEKLEEANVRLLELDKLKSALLSSVSHELRTPLTSIMGFAKLIERDFQHHAKDAEQSDNPRLNKIAKRIDKNLDIINTEAERLTRLINELLDLSSVESGRAQMHDTLFNFADILGPSLSRLEPGIKELPDVLICIEIAGNLPPIMADVERFIQVMHHLIENAVKFTPKGHISITACSANGWIQVRVKDSGIGMDKKNLLRVFESFHQITEDDESLISKPKGSGLGLSLCQSILTHYNGIIWCESESGAGTEVVFEIPSAIAE